MESKKEALYGTPVDETTKIPSIEIHKYSSLDSVYIHVMFTNNLKHVATKKDPITRKIKRIEIGERGTDYYDKGGKLLY